MNKAKICTSIIATLALISQVSAGIVDVTGGFNVLTFGNFTSWNDQTWGTLGASGNVTILNSYSIGTQWANTGSYPENAVVAGGDVTLTGGGSVWGGISSGGSVVSQQTVHGAINGNLADINSVFDFSQAKNELTQISNQFASDANNVAAEVKWGGIFFTGNNDVNYFTVNAADFQNISYLNFNIKDGSQAIITVTGDNASLVPSWGGNFGIQGLGNDGGKAYSNNILWNFVDASKLKIGGSIGTILGVNAQVELVGGEIWGDLITGSVNGSSEIHLAHYNGDIPTNDVPESSTATLLLIGGICLLLISMRKLAFRK